MRGRSSHPRQARAAHGAHALRGSPTVSEEHGLRVTHLTLGFAFEAVREDRVRQFLTAKTQSPKRDRRTPSLVIPLRAWFESEILGLLARAQLVHDLFHVLRAVARADEQRVVCVHDHEIR